MWPSTPATLQYSLTMAASCRSLRRDTTARIRASSRAFASSKDRITAVSQIPANHELRDRFDPIADTNFAATEKVGAQAPSMHQTRYHAGARKSLQVHARLT